MLYNGARMKEPMVQFKTEEELKYASNPRLNAMKIRGYIGCLIPLICIACAVAFVMTVIRLGPPAPALAPNRRTETPAQSEKEAAEASKKAVTERNTLANLISDSASSGASANIAKTDFEVGDEVQPVTDCMGFSDETDLNAFRAMLRHGDAAKARAYFEQLVINHKAIKLPALLRMTVAASSWNGSQQVIVGTEQWWLAQEWLTLADDEGDAEATTATADEQKSKKISEISETDRNAATETEKEMEKMKSIDLPAAEIKTE